MKKKVANSIMIALIVVVALVGMIIMFNILDLDIKEILENQKVIPVHHIMGISCPTCSSNMFKINECTKQLEIYLNDPQTRDEVLANFDGMDMDINKITKVQKEWANGKITCYFYQRMN